MHMQTSANQSRRLRTPEASDYTGLSVSTLTKYRVHGGGPKYYKIGRAVIYDTADLDTWLAECRRASTSAAA